MKLWKRASGLLKDQNSIWIASLTRKTTLRNPDIETAVIRATSHDEDRIDYKNAQKVFAWIRLSTAYIKPLVWAISVRMEKTRSWVVALKGLMLMHGVFCCQVPAVSKIGRLPFDLSCFRDAHSKPRKTWGYNIFIRAYYAFLDQKSTFIFLHSNDRRGGGESTGDKEQYNMKQDIVCLQKLQGLLDLLLQIKPQADDMVNVLVLEAMDCVIMEIFDVYSRICNGIARVLMRIYSAGKVEAAMALKVLRKATVQSEELSLYFEFCRDMGVIHASDCPRVEQIPEEDIREIELIINGVAERWDMDEKKQSKVTYPKKEKKSIAVKEANNNGKQQNGHDRKESKSSLQTIITDKWEVFEEEEPKKVIDGRNGDGYFGNGIMMVNEGGNDPFAASMTLPALHVHSKSEDFPDLISFL